MANSKKPHVYKSAVDGQFVTKKFADAHPKTTFRETVKPHKPKGK